MTLASSITYRPFGPVAQMSLGNGLSVAFTYDGDGNVTGDTHLDGTVFGYGYDGDGRLATITRNALAEASYGYEAFRRRVLRDPDGPRTSTGSRPRAVAARTTSAGCDQRPYWAGAGIRLRSSLPGA